MFRDMMIDVDDLGEDKHQQKVHECPGLLILLKGKWVKKVWEDIDNRGRPGYTWTLEKGGGFGESIMFQYCPACGTKIQEVANIPEGKCELK